MEKGEVARYGGYADWYEFGTSLNGFSRVPVRLAKLFREAAGPIAPGRHLLDFGCGTGRLTRAFLRSQPCLAITGVEPGRAMAGVYRKGMADTCRLFEGGIDGDVPFLADQSFDVIASAGVFDHIARPELALTRLMRVLKPGGHLAFSYERNPDPARDYEVRRAIYHRFSASFMARAVQAAGADIVHQENMFGFLRTTGISRGTPPQLAHYGLVVARKPLTPGDACPIQG